MTIAASDITFTLSGGETNNDPTQALGGEPSIYPIAEKKLFPNVTADESLNGLTDYRCFYVNNDSADSSLWGSEIFIESQTDGGGTVALGFNFQDEQQVITVSSTNQITSGNFVLTYTQTSGDTDFTVTWDSDPVVWAGNFQTAIREVENLEEVTVGYTSSETTVSFEVDFVGTSGNRSHDILVVKTNNISPNGIPVSVEKTVDGGPINSVADEIDVGTTQPFGINFVTSSEDDPVSIGTLRPLDSFPVWVRRVIEEESDAVENDGFSFRFRGNALA